MHTLNEKLTAFLDGFMTEYGLPGYDCSVWQYGKEIYRCTKGYADVENNILYSNNTLLHIYSNTKVIACTAALQLWEQGMFKLDDPISLYFPEMGTMQVQTEAGVVPANREITIQDLFTMTAGIGDGGDYQEMGMQFYMETGGACPILELPRFLARTHLKFHPGEGYCYGICHEVLAALIVKLTGKGFGEYLRENIFEPLGMTNTAFQPAGCVSQELATQYSIENPEKIRVNLGNTNVLIPPILFESASGGLISTVDDYMKFQEAMRKNLLLKPETVDLMRSNKLCGKPWDGYGYTANLGYGLGVRTPKEGVGPYGWGGAAGTLGLIDPENELTAFYAQQFFGTRDIQGNNELVDVIYNAL